jgi:hypothetical protein
MANNRDLTEVFVKYVFAGAILLLLLFVAMLILEVGK